MLFFSRVFTNWAIHSSVFAGFAHPDGDVVTFAKVEVGPDDALVGSGPVFVEGVGDVRVEGLAEDREVAVPLRTAEKENVVRVFLSYLGGYSFVERLKQRIQRCELGKSRDRFIDQIVAEDSGFIAVVF